MRPRMVLDSLEQIHAVGNDLNTLRHFADGIEKNLRNTIRDIERSSSSDENLWRPAEVLPWLYRASALLTILGFLEHNLNAICESLGKECHCGTRITDLPGKGLRRSKLYLQKHIGIDFPAAGDAWFYLLKYSDIRNLIAHRDSLVKDDDPELIRFIELDPNLSIDATGRVRLHEGALPDVIDHLDVFFGELARTLPRVTS